MSTFVQSLESRVLLSVTPAKVPSEAVLQAKAAIVAELKAIASEKGAISDLVKVARADYAAGTHATDVANLIEAAIQFSTDKKAGASADTLAADKAAITSDKATVKSDFSDLITYVKATIANGNATVKSDLLTLKQLVKNLALARKNG